MPGPNNKFIGFNMRYLPLQLQLQRRISKRRMTTGQVNLQLGVERRLFDH